MTDFNTDKLISNVSDLKIGNKSISKSLQTNASIDLKEQLNLKIPEHEKKSPELFHEKSSE